jgi:PAS domain S-box-containing protein
MVALALALAFSVAGALYGVLGARHRRFDEELERYYGISREMLATVDLSGRFTRVNPAWTRVLGHPGESLCSRALVELVHRDERAAVRATLDATADSSRAGAEGCSRFATTDGKYRWLRWSASAWPTDGAIRILARDVTQQRTTQQQLANSARWLEARVLERTHELEQAQAETVELLAGAIAYRDRPGALQDQRVGQIAAEIATRLGLRAEQVGRLRQAARLLDIGKLAVPDRILQKAGNLSPEERGVMETHAALGALLLSRSSSPVLQMAAVIAASHHEWWDGSGYPNGLTGERIPLLARIVAVADGFAALTHERPHMPAWPVTQALAEIQCSSGSRFDPRVVGALRAVCEGGQPAGAGPDSRGGQAPSAEAPSGAVAREWRRASAPRVRPGARGALR